MNTNLQIPQTQTRHRRRLLPVLLAAVCLVLNAHAATPGLSESAKKLVGTILALAKKEKIELKDTEAMRKLALEQLADPKNDFGKAVLAAVACRSENAAAALELGTKLEKDGEIKRDSEAWKEKFTALEKDCPDPLDVPKTKNQTKTATNEYPAIPISSKVNFYIGAISLNPYSLSKNTNGTYDFSPRDKASTDMFIELRYINRWSLSSKCETIFDSDGHRSTGWRPWGGKHGNLFDVDARLGFVLRDSGTNQQFSANSAIGGGDFHSELNLGFPIFRQSYSPIINGGNPTHAHAINLEIGGGAVTEKTFQAVHPIAFAGVGYHVSFLAPFSTEKAKSKGKDGEEDAGEYASYGTFSTRIGIGLIDQPEFTDVTGTTVKAERGLPRFSLEAHPVWESEVYFPIPNKNIMLTVAGRMYFADAPAPWTISVGLNLGLDKVMGLFQ